MGLVVLLGLASTGTLLGCTASPSRPATLTAVAPPHNPEADPDGIGWTVRLGGRIHPQRTYRLVVSTDPHAVDTVTDGGVDPNTWDSGVVHSTEHTGLRPSGLRVEQGVTYYWSVRVQDAQGHDSGWSAREQWTVMRP
ncbi:hypothetical protein ACFZBU_31400 [Embleya sp. NPDC008237]|uniref:glycoside hydrolase family 78 protein n=1 Tax=Embleya sp. NPDC008237 TaxID=3363978 RepID=UPI0036EDD47D